METENNPRRLYRSPTDRIIAGVCGGIAEYARIDSTVIRVIFLILAFAGGSGIILYIVLIFIMPLPDESTNFDPREKMREFVEKATNTVRGNSNQSETNQAKAAWSVTHYERRRRRALFLGALFVVLGILFLARELFPVYWFSIRADIFWPLILIFFGIYFLSRSRL